jgi:hypothetical protein
MIVPGPQIEIYPAPALPSLVVTHLSEDAVQSVLEAARGAGLMEGDASYGYDCIADAPTTTFTINAEGRTNVVSAYALGLDDGGDCPGVDPGARAKLSAFWTRLGNLPSLAPEGSLGREEPYEPTELRVFVLPDQHDPELPQEPMPWPLERSLEAFGEPSDGLEGVRCGVVSGADLDPVLEAVGSANQLTPWTSDGTKHRLIFRPLLPDEHGC